MIMIMITTTTKKKKKNYHQNCTLLILYEGNPLVTSGFTHKWPVMQKAFPYYDVLRANIYSIRLPPVSVSFMSLWSYNSWWILADYFSTFLSIASMGLWQSYDCQQWYDCHTDSDIIRECMKKNRPALNHKKNRSKRESCAKFLWCTASFSFVWRTRLSCGEIPYRYSCNIDTCYSICMYLP